MIQARLDIDQTEEWLRNKKIMIANAGNTLGSVTEKSRWGTG